MKKPVIAALCCFLALGTATAAFAEEPTTASAPELVELSPEDTAPPFYPDSISWQEDGGQLLVVKQYSVPYGTTVADLTEKHYAVERRRLHPMGRHAVCGGRCDRRKRGHAGF